MPSQIEIDSMKNISAMQKYFMRTTNMESSLSGRPFTHELASAKPLPRNPLENTMPTPVDRLTANKGCNILEFATMQKELLNKVWGNDWGLFTLEYNTGKSLNDTKLPVITFDVMSRVPSKAKPGLKPRIYVIGQDDLDPNYLIIQHTQWYDVIVEYNICHTTMNEAFELMAEFEVFNTVYTGYFKQNGIMELIFRQEVPTSSTLKMDSTIPSRCVYYDMVIQNIHLQRVRATDEILAVTEVADQQQL